jgi:hypothetical protein
LGRSRARGVTTGHRTRRPRPRTAGPLDHPDGHECGSDLHRYTFRPLSAPIPADGAIRPLGTAWGSTRDTQGTEGGRRRATVNNRRDVHVSTTEGRSPPTIGQQGHVGPEQRKEARSPASTRVMTRMRELSRRFWNHTLGGEAAPATLQGISTRSRTGQRLRAGEALLHGAQQLIEGPGFPPGGQQQAR